MHRTAEEAEARTVQMLNVYADFFEKDLGMPVIRGQKTDKEKFAGALATYTVEALMHDGKALQGGTSHNFGDGFAKAFGIQYCSCLCLLGSSVHSMTLLPEEFTRAQEGTRGLFPTYDRAPLVVVLGQHEKI